MLKPLNRSEISMKWNEMKWNEFFHIFLWFLFAFPLPRLVLRWGLPRWSAEALQPRRALRGHHQAESWNLNWNDDVFRCVQCVFSFVFIVFIFVSSLFIFASSLCSSCFCLKHVSKDVSCRCRRDFAGSPAASRSSGLAAFRTSAVSAQNLHRVLCLFFFILRNFYLILFTISMYSPYIYVLFMYLLLWCSFSSWKVWT